MANPIGPFDLEAEIAAAGNESALEESKVDTKSKTELQQKSAVKQSDEVPESEPLGDINGPIYERIVIIVPYKCPETVKHIEAIFERINLAGLNLENARYLNTKELTEEERADRTLDFLGGFEIMDNEFRMFVIEGLGGSGHSMD